MIFRCSCYVCQHLNPEVLAFVLTHIMPHAGHNHTGHGV